MMRLQFRERSGRSPPVAGPDKRKADIHRRRAGLHIPITLMKSIHLLIPAAAILAGCQSTPTDAPPPDRFALADANNDGKVSRLELSNAVDTTVFTACDPNKDGSVTRAEWSPGNDADDLKEFRLNDANGDGTVTLAEFTAHARKSAGRDEGFKQADLDRDGLLSREEAQAYYASKEGPMH
jgi:Ca2+-binding EF-hand superfamily protein